MNQSKSGSSVSRIPLPKGVTWEEFISVISRKDNWKFLNSIDPETYKYLLDEDDHQKVKRKMIQSLQKTDPKNATEKYAEQIITAMKEVAQLILKQQGNP